MPSSQGDPRRDAAMALCRAGITELQEALAAIGTSHLDALFRLAVDVAEAWNQGGKLLLCGNGGSAADAQHIAAELVGRFLRERRGYAALALSANTSILTSVGNDYGFEQVFSRQVEALGDARDVLLVISTSGNSPNCLRAVECARQMGMRSHGLLGGDGGRLRDRCDSALVAPSASTPKIQEMHITFGHLLCRMLEDWQAGGAIREDARE